MLRAAAQTRKLLTQEVLLVSDCWGRFLQLGRGTLFTDKALLAKPLFQNVLTVPKGHEGTCIMEEESAACLCSCASFES
jgi:hypothetical protein